MNPLRAFALLSLLTCVSASAAEPANDPPPALRPYAPPPEAEVREWPNDKLISFMRELTDYVYRLLTTDGR